MLIVKVFMTRETVGATPTVFALRSQGSWVRSPPAAQFSCKPLIFNEQIRFFLAATKLFYKEHSWQVIFSDVLGYGGFVSLSLPDTAKRLVNANSSNLPELTNYPLLHTAFA